MYDICTIYAISQIFGKQVSSPENSDSGLARVKHLTRVPHLSCIMSFEATYLSRKFLVVACFPIRSCGLFAIIVMHQKTLPIFTKAEEDVASDQGRSFSKRSIVLHWRAVSSD